MLTNIKIKNIYSIKELEMSFLKGKFGYKKEMISNDVVNPVGIYGENGSGKSNVVNVINDLLNLLIKDKDTFYPFIVNFNNKQENSSVELSFKIDEDEYVYSVTTSFIHSRIEGEYLLKNNIPVFTRNLERTIIEDKEISVEDNLMLSLRSLFSEMENINSYKEDIKKVYTYLTNITIVNGSHSFCNSKLCNYRRLEDLIVENSEEIKRVISNFKDFPLFDFFKENDEYYLHLYRKNNDKVKLPIIFISEGMLTISKLLALILNLDYNSVLFIDGIEKNLHPKTILDLIKFAKSRDIQLIFTSHNTSLMQELRPDQIYFARLKEGNSYYFRLSNIYENIIEINNIEKMYLSNTFESAINKIINLE